MLVNQPNQGSHPLTSSEWEARWRRLSAPARLAVVRDVRAPVNPGSSRPPFITVRQLLPAIVQELTAAGFVERQPGPSPQKPDRLIVPPSSFPFVTRVQDLYRFHLLAADRPPDLLG